MSWKTPQIIIPFCFFGYAALTNAAVLQNGSVTVDSAADLLTGNVAQQVDTLYRQNLPLRKEINGALGAGRYALLSEGRKGVIAGENGWLFSAEEARGAPAQPLQHSVTRIAEMAAQLAEMGAQIVIIPLPAKIDIAASKAGLPEISALRQAEYAEFVRLLQQADIRVVDTHAVFAETGPQAFFKTDTHWRASTAVKVAERVAQSGLITLGSADFVTENQMVEPLTGDLVNFVTNAAYAPLVGLPDETPAAFIALPEQDASATIDLFAAPDPVQTVLIGTSYSANPNWSFVEALKLSLKQDVLNLAAAGQGPVAPLQEFIANGHQSLDAMPQTIIWEFPIRYLGDPNLWSSVERVE